MTTLSMEDKELIAQALFKLSCTECMYDVECSKEENNYACMRVKSIIMKL